LKRFLINKLEMLVGALWKQNKLLTHCCGSWKPLENQSRPTCTLQLLLGAPLKAKCLYIKVAFGPVWKQGIYTLQLLLGAPLKAELLLDALVKAEYVHITVAVIGTFEGRVLNFDVVQNILYERIMRFSPKMKNIYARNTLSGCP